MSQVGAFSQQALAVQEAQIAIIKNNAEMQQKTIEVLLESADNIKVSKDPRLGNIVDFTV